MTTQLLAARSGEITDQMKFVAEREQLSVEKIREEVGLPDGPGYRTWRVLIRYVVPVAVAIIFVGGLVG